MVKFTIKRGRVVSESARQHRFLHAAALDHTHIHSDGSRKRETFTSTERKHALAHLRMQPIGISEMEKGK